MTHTLSIKKERQPSLAVVDKQVATQSWKPFTLRADVVMVKTDPLGFIVWASKGFNAMTGYSLKEMLGKKPGALLQGKDTDKATVDRIREAILQQKPIEEDILNYKKSGLPYWVRMLVTPVFNQSNKIDSFVSILSDITKTKAKENELKVFAKNARESVEYAALIQDGLLPKLESLKKVCKDYFVLYQPKDVLSGDFYWLQHHANQALLAVGDATGHGVPGAMMATLGTCVLNQILLTSSSMHTNVLLDQLHRQVFCALNRERHDSRLLDGMDIALVRINPLNQTVEFSGARCNLLLFRAGVFSFLRGDRVPIGGYHPKDQGHTFGKHELKIEPGDMIYLYTDGITDVRLGPGSRKLTPKGLLELLAKANTPILPMKNQKKMLAAHVKKWRAQHKQLDDILIIGMQFA